MKGTDTIHDWRRGYFLPEMMIKYTISFKWKRINIRYHPKLDTWRKHKKVSYNIGGNIPPHKKMYHANSAEPHWQITEKKFGPVKVWKIGTCISLSWARLSLKVWGIQEIDWLLKITFELYLKLLEHFKNQYFLDLIVFLSPHLKYRYW